MDSSENTGWALMTENRKILLGLSGERAQPPSSDQESRPRDLADREEIRELTARYAHRTAHGVSIADLFTDDGVLIVNLPGQPTMEMRGHSALTEFSGGRTPGTSLPMMHNHLIQVEGDRAIGLCSNEVRVSNQGKSIIGSGYFEDEFQRVNGRWKFTVRRMTYIHWTTIQDGWAK